MTRTALIATACVLTLSLARAGELKVTGIKAEHRDGQTFVTWKDVAEGQAGAKYQYSVYRSAKPITSVAGAPLCMKRVFHNSAKMFGSAFWTKDRLDPKKPTCILTEGGTPLPNWTGLAVVTVAKPGKSYYAVVATEAGKPVTKIVPGESATKTALEEKPAPIQPIKLYDSKKRGRYWKQTCISGKKGLPLSVGLHASSGRGGGAGAWGDYYLYFSRPEWGYRDGLPGIFTVQERRHVLMLNSREAIVTPNGKRAMETYWFGYVCVPQWAKHTEPRAYNFTEKRALWMVDWTIKKYGADPERVTCGGGSMGAWGSMTFAIRHPEVFAAVYPNRPRTRQRGRPGLIRVKRGTKVMMADGKTDYFDRMNMVEFVKNHPADLPFIGWCCGRRDGFASWKEQIDMVHALTEAKHGFAFAWNNGDHSSGSRAMRGVTKYFGSGRFARNKSYPAFGNSSINDNMGKGDPKEGDLGNIDKKKGKLEVFGINLGFKWQAVVDEPGKWSAKISNERCKGEMTVDVTPRRCQKFKAKAGEKFNWSSSLGDKGSVTADKNGLVTITKLKLKTGATATLTISR
jgi:pimeloyl-ACP methyl ester carboxylesterase